MIHLKLLPKVLLYVFNLLLLFYSLCTLSNILHFCKCTFSSMYKVASKLVHIIVYLCYRNQYNKTFFIEFYFENNDEPVKLLFIWVNFNVSCSPHYSPRIFVPLLKRLVTISRESVKFKWKAWNIWNGWAKKIKIPIEIENYTNMRAYK